MKYTQNLDHLGDIFDDEDLTIDGGDTYAPRSWWHDEENYYNSNLFKSKKGRVGFRFSQNYRDIITSHAERTKNLIGSITGKELQIKLADNYGIDKKAIYLDENDNALGYITSDGYLGKVSQLLAKGLFYNTALEKEIKKQEGLLPLYYALEQARNQEQLANEYGGGKYYLSRYWQEAGQDELERHEALNQNALLSAIFERGNNFKPITLGQDISEAVENYLKAQKKGELRKAFDQVAKHFTPAENSQEQREQERGAKSLTNNQLTGAQKRQATNAQPQPQQEANSNSDGKIPQKRKGQLAQGKLGGHGKHLLSRPKDKSFFARTSRKHAQLIGLITRQLASILKDNETQRFQHHLKRGKIDKRSLHKIATGSERVFKKRLDLHGKHYAFALCLDRSGSMNDYERNIHASEAVVVVASVLHNLNLPFALYGYNGETELLKDYLEPHNPRHYDDLTASFGGTNDTKLFEQVFADLYGLNDTTALVITDGESNDFAHAKQARERIEEGNRNKVFGIGIGGEISKHTLERTYKSEQTLVVGEVSALKNELVSLLRNQFRRA